MSNLTFFARKGTQRGFTLIELMVAVTISLLLLAGLGAMYANLSNTNNEMAKSNAQIESGRFSIQLLQSDIVHSGFWGGFTPQFDDQTMTGVPADVPTAVPDPCLDYNPANWNAAYLNNLLGISVQAYEHDSIPAACAAILTNVKADTDVLVVRHAETCLPGAANCDPDVAGKLYFQTSFCDAEAGGYAQAGSTATTINMAANASATPNAYAGMTLRTVSGTGAGQTRAISAYDSATKIATVSSAWTTTPDNTTTYSIDYVLGSSGFNLHKKDCVTVAEKRRFISDIYYIRTYLKTPGDGIPTLMRSQFDLASGVLKHQDPVELIEGIEGFRVELGVDNVVTRAGLNTTVNYGVAAALVDPATGTVNADTTKNTLPTNRGDGNPDGTFIRCTTAVPCTAAQLTDIVAVKLYLLARNQQNSLSHTDTKTYNLGTAAALGPFNDNFKRHVFATTVRISNISGRRETQ